MAQALQMANTTKGWAIAIMITKNHRTGADIYEVVRANPNNQHVTLTRHDEESAARKSANNYWLADRN